MANKMYFYGVKIHEKYMLRCITLAKKGLGTTYPNPMVGSVIVHEEKIIGEGWHYKAGMPHAEVNAINSVAEPTLLKKSTLYVTLEPCSHFGKTPPCADLIIKSGIKKVVIGSTDPNPQVAGRGIQKLIQAGCDVVVGISLETCDELNKRFFTYHLQKRPYVILKWAQTKDGFIAPDPVERSAEKAPVWITNSYSRQRVHKIRAEEQAILVGTNTVATDNPSLTVRDWSGNSPIRVVIDKELKLPEEASVFNKAATTIVLSEKEKENTPTVVFEKIDFSSAIVPQILEVLYRYKIQSVLVEGGSFTLQSFINSNLWDEAVVFTGTAVFKNGIQAPHFKGNLFLKEKIKKDILQHYKNPTS